MLKQTHEGLSNAERQKQYRNRLRNHLEHDAKIVACANEIALLVRTVPESGITLYLREIDGDNLFILDTLRSALCNAETVSALQQVNRTPAKKAPAKKAPAKKAPAKKAPAK